MTQRQRILNYINENGSITPLDAFTELGITKLATRISSMIRDGYPIQKKREKSVNRYGETCYYMRYSINKMNKGS